MSGKFTKLSNILLLLLILSGSRVYAKGLPCTESKLAHLRDMILKAPMAKLGFDPVRENLLYLDVDSCSFKAKKDLFWWLAGALWKYPANCWGDSSGKRLYFKLKGITFSDPVVFLKQMLKDTRSPRLYALLLFIAVERYDFDMIREIIKDHGKELQAFELGKIALLLARDALKEASVEDFTDLSCNLNVALKGYKRFKKKEILQTFWNCPDQKKSWLDMTYSGVVYGLLDHLEDSQIWPPSAYNNHPQKTEMYNLYYFTLECCGEEEFMKHLTELLQKGWKDKALVNLAKSSISAQKRRSILKQLKIPRKIRRLLW